MGMNKQERDEQKLMGFYQAWRLGDWEKDRLGLRGVEWVEWPLVKIQFSVSRGRGRGGWRRGAGGEEGGRRDEREVEGGSAFQAAREKRVGRRHGESTYHVSRGSRGESGSSRRRGVRGGARMPSRFPVAFSVDFGE